MPDMLLFLVYDGRAILEGTEEAAVLSSATSLREARLDARAFEYECAIYRYRVQPSQNGLPDKLIDETFVESV